LAIAAVNKLAEYEAHYSPRSGLRELYVLLLDHEQGLLFVENVRDYFPVSTFSAAEQFGLAHRARSLDA
jgi:hypothetical protein